MDKFTADIENASGVLNLDLNNDYTDPINRDERLWIALFTIQKYLKRIAWLIFFAAGFILLRSFA